MIAVAPTDSNVIYVGTDDSHVWVTTNSGNNWTEISGTLPYRWVTRVVVDPTNESTVYVTFSGLKWRDPQPHVFKSTNKGETWTDISSNLPDAPVNAFAVDNNITDVLYLGNDVGAFISLNRGEEWELLGAGLPVVSVYDMKIHPVENYLAVGTHGRSMYKINLDEVLGTVDEKSPNTILSYSLQQNYPNPFNPSTKIKYTIPTSPSVPLLSKERDERVRLVTLKVYDILGKEVTTLVNEEKPIGNYELEFDASQLSSGIYFYKLEVGSYSETKKMVLLK